jgi:hypothetical protein
MRPTTKYVNENSVGRPIYQKVMITQNEQDVFIGDSAVSIHCIS